jgi:hypothetical protein
MTDARRHPASLGAPKPLPDPELGGPEASATIMTGTPGPPFGGVSEMRVGERPATAGFAHPTVPGRAMLEHGKGTAVENDREEREEEAERRAEEAAERAEEAARRAEEAAQRAEKAEHRAEEAERGAEEAEHRAEEAERGAEGAQRGAEETDSPDSIYGGGPAPAPGPEPDGSPPAPGWGSDTPGD